MRHSETACLWKATLQSLGPDALFRTISSEVNFYRLQTEPQVPRESDNNTVFHQCVILPYSGVNRFRLLCYETRLANTHTPIGTSMVSASHVKSDTPILGRAALVICLRGSRGMIRGVVGVALHWAESRGLYRVRVRRSS